METLIKTKSITDQRLYLLKKSMQYIAHSRKVYLHSLDRNAAVKKLAICEELLCEVRKLHQVYSIREVCSTIVRLREKLKLILPNENNASYNKSVMNLSEIITTAYSKTQTL